MFITDEVRPLGRLSKSIRIGSSRIRQGRNLSVDVHDLK